MLKSPFPYFGGKSSVASLVWLRLGNVPNYIEPFFGSGAVLLARPHDPDIETVNDLDCLLSNFWRAVIENSDEVAKYADYPVIETDLHARHKWLIDKKPELRALLESSPDAYDAKAAGWWVWGISCWIGSGWCASLRNQLPHLGDKGKGVHRKLPHLGDKGNGVHRSSEHDLRGYMQALSDRLRRVRVCCGDWKRVLTPCVTTRHGITGVFLDPPYSDCGRDKSLYAEESLTVALDVLEWCKKHGDNPLFRITLCGYEGEKHHELEAMGWDVVQWKATGGYSNQCNNSGKENRHRERIWFSPHCLKDDLFGALEE